MAEVWPTLGLLLAAFGLVCLVWLAYGALLLPGVRPVETAVEAAGDGEGLEQTVKALLWLRRAGLLWGEIVLEDRGLTERGAELCRALARLPHVRFTGDEPDRIC